MSVVLPCLLQRPGDARDCVRASSAFLAILRQSVLARTQASAVSSFSLNRSPGPSFVGGFWFLRPAIADTVSAGSAEYPQSAFCRTRVEQRRVPPLSAGHRLMLRTCLTGVYRSAWPLALGSARGVKRERILKRGRGRCFSQQRAT